MIKELINLLEEYAVFVDNEAETKYGSMDLRGFLVWLKDKK